VFTPSFSQLETYKLHTDKLPKLVYTNKQIIS